MLAAPASRPLLAVVVGKESCGKSQFVSSLTGKKAYSANFRGSTVRWDVYEAEVCEGEPKEGGSLRLVDTPGILYRSDSETTRAALAALQGGDSVLLMAKGSQLDDDLCELLPLLTGGERLN